MASRMATKTRVSWGYPSIEPLSELSNPFGNMGDRSGSRDAGMLWTQSAGKADVGGVATSLLLFILTARDGPIIGPLNDYCGVAWRGSNSKKFC